MIRLAGILSLVIATGCSNRRYFAEGPSGRFDVSGDYQTAERPIRTNCRTVSAAAEDGIITVMHGGNSTQVVLVRGKETYVAEMRSDGRFRTAAAATGSSLDQAVTGATIEGQFSRSGFRADVTVRAIDDIPPTTPARRPAANTTRTCEYVVRWDGKRVN